MASERIYVTLSPAQKRVVVALCKKLQLDRANLIRMAIAKIAESEGIKM